MLTIFDFFSFESKFSGAALLISELSTPIIAWTNVGGNLLRSSDSCLASDVVQTNFWGTLIRFASTYLSNLKQIHKTNKITCSEIPAFQEGVGIQIPS